MVVVLKQWQSAGNTNLGEYSYQLNEIRLYTREGRNASPPTPVKTVKMTL